MVPSRPSRTACLALPFLVAGCGFTELTAERESPSDSSQEQPLATSAKLGTSIDVDNPAGNPTAAQLLASGARTVRFSFKDDSWGADPDPAALSRYREKLDELAAAGIQTLLIFSYESVPGFPVQSTDKGAWDAYRARYVARLAKVAAAYGDSVAAYEIWNEMDEPNNRPEYAPWIPPERYGELLRDAYQTIKAHSAAVVVTGGADSGDPSYLRVARDSVGHLYADAVGLHPYGQRPDPWWPYATWGFGDLADLVDRYHAATSRPIWITEVGVNDPSLQAEMLERTLRRLSGSSASKVDRILWFCWSDGMVDGFGLLDANGAPHDSYWRFRAAAAAMAQPAGLADVVVTEVRLVPSSPKPGDAVRLYARVKNVGGQATGAHVGVAYRVDGQYLGWGAAGALGVGEEVNGFQSTAPWIATAGTHLVSAIADDVNRFPEQEENNNGRDLSVVVASGIPPPSTPIIHRACFTRFWVPGDSAPSIRADVEIEVPGSVWTQPMGTGASSCDWFGPGESFRTRFPEIGGAWRIGIDVNGAAKARDDLGVDHPWRFALREDGCGLTTNEAMPATPGHYTVSGFFKLAPGDASDPAQFYAGMVQEGQRWWQDGKGCP